MSKRPAEEAALPLLFAWVAGVGELAELARDQVGHALADIDGVVADSFQAMGDNDGVQTRLASLFVAAQRHDPSRQVTVLGVDHRVHRHEPFAAFGVPLGV